MIVKFYKVGGCVRDELIGVPFNDIDFSVEAPSFEHMKNEILNRGGTIYVEKPEFLTIRAKVPQLGTTDYVLSRKEGDYSDGRRPDKVEPGSIYDDLARRDFTMNAIAKDENGNLIDPFDGQEDIKQRLIRCVGSPRERLQEDSLRILRALRFSLTKHFGIEQDTEAELQYSRNARLLKNVSRERIYEELKKMFTFDTPAAISMLQRYPAVYKEIFFTHNIKLSPAL